jgi:hypothetical protein
MRADETHCEHGTYIGYPGGADYLCGWCEDGVSYREYSAIMRQQRHNRMVEEATTLNMIWDALRDPKHNVKPHDRDAAWAHMLETYSL